MRFCLISIWSLPVQAQEHLRVCISAKNLIFIIKANSPELGASAYNYHDGDDLVFTGSTAVGYDFPNRVSLPLRIKIGYNGAASAEYIGKGKSLRSKPPIL